MDLSYLTEASDEPRMRVEAELFQHSFQPLVEVTEPPRDGLVRLLDQKVHSLSVGILTRYEAHSVQRIHQEAEVVGLHRTSPCAFAPYLDRGEGVAEVAGVHFGRDRVKASHAVDDAERFVCSLLRDAVR